MVPRPASSLPRHLDKPGHPRKRPAQTLHPKRISPVPAPVLKTPNLRLDDSLDLLFDVLLNRLNRQRRPLLRLVVHDDTADLDDADDSEEEVDRGKARKRKISNALGHA